MNSRLAIGVLTAGLDWFVPRRVRDGRPELLRPARLMVAFSWTLIPLAIFYGVLMDSMNSPIGAAWFGVAIGAALVSLYVMRRTGSCFIAGNLLTAALFGVLTAASCRLGGNGSFVLFWYATVPVVALSIVGQRSAIFWFAVTLVSLSVFHAFDYSSYSFPNDLTLHHFELLRLLSRIGLIVLMLTLALLYEMSKNRALAELINAEDRLLREKNFSDSAIASLPGIFYLFDNEGKFLRWNENFEHTSGYSPKELSKMRPLDFFRGQCQESIKRGIEDVFTKGQAAMEADFIPKDRIAIPHMFSGKRVMIAGRQHILGTGIDITERKRAEEERKILLHNMRERVKEMTCMYKVANSVHQRDTLEDIFLDTVALIPPGWQYPEITRGRITFEGKEYVIEPFENTTWKQACDIMVNGEQCGAIEVYYLEDRPELYEGPFMKEERNLLDGLSQTLGEAIVQKRAEQQIQDYAAVLESNNLTLEQLNQAAEAANRAKSEFLANMSHEIRTPMTAILGFSEILMGNMKDQEQLDAVMIIKQNGEHLLKIINDILDLSKIEAGKLEVERIQCSPCQILSEVISLMRVRANAKNLSLEVEYHGPIPQSIQSDPTQLRQILINLIGNAIKFTEVGKVRLVARLLDAQSDEPKMRFEVVDSGIGITDQQAAKLFKPFQQVDTSTTRRFGGTGLGLTISKRLADNLGGGITFKSTLGEGSTFTVTVETGPLDGVKLLDSPTEAQISTDPDKKPSAFKTKLDCRVLLAEDGPDNQRLISFILKKAGAEVTVADNGRIAYDLVLAARDEGNPFDVILMDMQMPVMDGYEATGRLRKAGFSGPIIALTAHTMSTDRDKCLDAACDDYMAKPIDHKKLISLVAEYTSRHELHKGTNAPVA